ncbi:MAG: hypothetical protein ACYTEQ_00710 [Planctomycetota bacterium]|jgi:hypothetical protein
MNEYQSSTIRLATCVGLVLLASCAETQRDETVGQICTPGASKAEAVQAAEDVLGRMHFIIDKADAEQGVVRTKPLSGAHFFELWRKDSVGAFNAAESNLHSIRRIAELEIAEKGGQLCIDCEVNVQRLSLPEHEVSSAGAYAMFSRSIASMQELRLRPGHEKKVMWLDLGNDDMLAAEILKRIEEKLGPEGK